jgi:hypothetical protein
VEREIVFQPRIRPEDFRCFFAAGTAWGIYSQKLSSGRLSGNLECRHGEVKLRHLLLGGDSVKATFSAVSVVAPDGRKVQCSVVASKQSYRIELKDELTLREGQTLTATLTGSGSTA